MLRLKPSTSWVRCRLYVKATNQKLIISNGVTPFSNEGREHSGSSPHGGITWGSVLETEEWMLLRKWWLVRKRLSTTNIIPMRTEVAADEWGGYIWGSEPRWRPATDVDVMNIKSQSIPTSGHFSHELRGIWSRADPEIEQHNSDLTSRSIGNVLSNPDVSKLVVTHRSEIV